MITSYCAWVRLNPPPLPRRSAFTLVISFCTQVHLRYQLHNICLCCCSSVEKCANHKIPNLYNSRPLHYAHYYWSFGDNVKNDSLASLPSLSAMAVQFKDENDVCCTHTQILEALRRNAFLNSSPLPCFGTVVFTPDANRTQVHLFMWNYTVYCDVKSLFRGSWCINKPYIKFW